MRGGRIESCHAIHAALVDQAGRLVASVGEPDTLTFIRSAAKPFQALALLRSKGVGQFLLTDEEIALICASHSGEDKHIQVLSKLMKKVGIQKDQLQCGFHPPYDLSQAENILKGLKSRGPTYNNCSGKHSGMIAACLLGGYQIEGYLEGGHPHQKSILSIISEFSEVDSEQISMATDGCGAPTYHLSLKQMAGMYARLAAGTEPELIRIRNAMSHHPEIVGGTGRFDSSFMQAVPGNAISKVGAEALQCFAFWNNPAMGVAVKSWDGQSRGVESASVEILFQSGFLNTEQSESLRQFWQPKIRNHVGEEVGHIVPDIVMETSHN